MTVGLSVTVRSRAFAEEERIPSRHTIDGPNVSPPLEWGPGPDGTLQWAIICDDPDAPRAEPWVHWIIYNIPADCVALPEGLPNEPELLTPDGATQGRNSFASGETLGYRGPAPPPGHGTHHYRFTIHALDTALDLPAGIDRDALEAAMEGHVLATGRLVGTYSR